MPAPLDSPDRLEALRASGLLDSPAEASFDRLTRLACRLLDAPVAMVSLLDDSRQFFKSCVGLSEALASERESGLEDSYCKFVVAVDEPLVVPDARNDPDFADHPGTATFDIGAYLGVPLRYEGQVLGSLCVLDHKAREWGEQHVTLLRELGDVVEAQMVLRTAGATAARAHQEAQQATARLQFLLQASEALSVSLDHRETLQALIGLCVPQLADWCVVDLVNRDGRVERLTLEPTGADGADLAQELMGYVPQVSYRRGVGAVLSSGEPLLMPVVTDADLVHVANDARHAELLRELGRRAGMAVDKAIVYRERDEIARTLQQSLLPPTLPEVPGLRLAARYAPQGRDQLVGGDFYDVFEAGEHWIVVVGDVRGKGTAAAAVTGLARHTIRAAAMGKRSPAAILGVLNDVLLADGSDPERFCTVACAAVKPYAGGAEVVLACGGHPGPLLRRADASVQEVAAEGMLLGLFEAPGITDVRLDLRAGDALLLYTDGVTEARSADGRFLGVDGLATVLRHAPDNGPSVLADAVTGAVADWQGDLPRDDLAVLVARVPGR